MSSYGGTQAAELQDGYASYAAVYRSYTWVRRAIDDRAQERRRLLLDYLLGAGLTILFGLLVSHSSSGLSESGRDVSGWGASGVRDRRPGVDCSHPGRVRGS